MIEITIESDRPKKLSLIPLNMFDMSIAAI